MLHFLNLQISVFSVCEMKNVAIAEKTLIRLYLLEGSGEQVF